MNKLPPTCELTYRTRNKAVYISLKIQDKLVNITTGYELDNQEIQRCSIPGRGKTFFSSPQYPERLWYPHSFLSKWMKVAFSPETNQPGSNSDHFLAASSEFKSAWSYTPIPPCLHCVVLNYVQ
jgi:hypothetical protein